MPSSSASQRRLPLLLCIFSLVPELPSPSLQASLAFVRPPQNLVEPVLPGLISFPGALSQFGGVAVWSSSVSRHIRNGPSFQLWQRAGKTPGEPPPYFFLRLPCMAD
jgi:hypothetical protein